MAHSTLARDAWQFSEPRFAGREVYHVAYDARTRLLWATTRHVVWGVHVHYSSDFGRSWEILPSTPHHDDARGVHAVWCIAPGTAAQVSRMYAGIEPAGLFVSDDAGLTWRASTLNSHPTCERWQPAGGALALHSVTVDPYWPDRVWCAVSAGGVYRSDDAGVNWQPRNQGTRADFLPQRMPESGQCVHKLLAHPARADRLYQQNHCGTYRSDDGGDSWQEITAGLPSDFGYVLATDPLDADSLFVIPEDSSDMRTTAGGQLRVYCTRDAGRTWAVKRNGLPQQDVYVSLLREAMCNDTLDPVGLYFGTSSGHLFASRDAGDHWNLIGGYLPRILSVSAAVSTD